MARMISGSKSGYHRLHPDNLIIFNANIITKSSGKIWYGDLDVNVDRNSLKELRDETKEDLYILYEHDCRFNTEDDSIDVLIDNAVCRVGEYKIYIADRYKEYHKDILYHYNIDD